MISTVNAAIPVVRGDLIRVFVYSKVATTIGVVARFQPDAGKPIKDQYAQLKSAANPLIPEVIEIPCSDGNLIGVTVYNATPAVPIVYRGSVYVVGQLWKSGNAPGQITLELIGDYVTDRQNASFPYKQIVLSQQGPGALQHSVIGPQAASLGAITFLLDPVIMWRVNALRVEYNAQLGVSGAGRSITWEIADGSAPMIWRTPTQQVNDGEIWEFLAGDYPDGTDPDGLDSGGGLVKAALVKLPLPILRRGCTVSVIPSGAIAAADTMTAYLWADQYIDV